MKIKLVSQWVIQPRFAFQKTKPDKKAVPGVETGTKLLQNNHEKYVQNTVWLYKFAGCSQQNEAKQMILGNKGASISPVKKIEWIWPSVFFISFYH